MDLFACEGEEHAYGGDAGRQSLLHTSGDTDLAELAPAASRLRAGALAGCDSSGHVHVMQGDAG